MNSLINVGDEIRNHQGMKVTVVGVEQGRYGLLVQGTFEGGYSFTALALWELPPVDETREWYAFNRRSHITLPNGIQIGTVGSVGENNRNLAYYEELWERTIEQIRKEGGE